MATAVQPTKPAVVVPVAQPVSYCGYCAGWRGVWCPDCAGFAGCATCRYTCKVPCPECADGQLLKWIP